MIQGKAMLFSYVISVIAVSYTHLEAGADLIEIGIPFSDPVAEGPVIQEADDRALSAGVTTDKIFDMVDDIADKIHVPIVFMTYINPIYVYGVEKFAKRAKACGAAGVIVPDVPFEEKEEIRGSFEAEGLVVISMVAPTSADRVRMIAKEAKGFLYCVSSLGVTGVRTEIGTAIGDLIQTVKEECSIPVSYTHLDVYKRQVERLDILISVET